MMAERELWQSLRVGDRVRVVEFPREFAAPGLLQPETQRAYEYLVQRRRPLTVWMIDEFGFPWVQFRLREPDGRMGHHTMALNHSGVHLVKRKQ